MVPWGVSSVRTAVVEALLARGVAGRALLVALVGRLVTVRGRLVAVRGRLVAVRGRLIAVLARLVLELVGVVVPKAALSSRTASGSGRGCGLCPGRSELTELVLQVLEPGV